MLVEWFEAATCFSVACVRFSRALAIGIDCSVWALYVYCFYGVRALTLVGCSGNAMFASVHGVHQARCEWGDYSTGVASGVFASWQAAPNDF